jgi:hypothetical protein
MWNDQDREMGIFTVWKRQKIREIETRDVAANIPGMGRVFEPEGGFHEAG